ncbi:unnamed protein product [Brassicogethes aeneus]|uniref:DUF4773 domain-containing protein n=1 Tax=Brassicogethes aeneus TaxID=1431903 RepID=A0A9P0FN84_BRAAE|nr:unnamed protein product [Brassicogethes aeneus]
MTVECLNDIYTLPAMLQHLNYLICFVFATGIFYCYAAREKFINVDACQCHESTCSCCFSNNFPSIPAQDVCLEAVANGNELSIVTNLKLNGSPLLTHTIDPSSVPFCVPQIPGLCLAINHVDLLQRKICVKISEAMVTLVKFPCFSLQDGKLTAERNNYP